MIRKFALLLTSLAFLTLAGCSSVSLDNPNPPVEERSTGAGMTGSGAGDVSGSAASTVTQTNVAPLGDDQSGRTAQGPAAGVPQLIYFDYDSYAIKPEFQAVVDSNARYLLAHPEARAVIAGHTDERGDSEYNLALGQRRSEVVRHALTLLGVADAQLEAISFGKEKPAVAGNGEEAWARNRRAEISYR